MPRRVRLTIIGGNAASTRHHDGGAVLGLIRATVYEAAKLLVNSRVSALPVVDENGVMVGILSEADILKGPLMAAKKVGTETLGRPADDAMPTLRSRRPRHERVTDVMTKGVIAAHETASLREVADLMLKHKIKRVPIVRDGSILGIVSRVDLRQGADLDRARRYTPRSRHLPLSEDQTLRRRDNGVHERSDWAVAQWFDVVVMRRRRPPLGRQRQTTP